ncbi:MAG: glycosyl transferase family 2 [Paludibacter sp. 47-17]|nr:MAG: glycosyltransferase [Paludibacter sp.]OJX91942.1 MAG: glycosyl transferase family 2 [Paludibacter sp. 47-17]
MLNISIVLYNHTWNSVGPLIGSLLTVKGLNELFIIDNSPSPSPGFADRGGRYIFTGSNRGYGAGHNIALRKSLQQDVPFHLVINPDIELNPSSVTEMMEYLQQHPDTGLLMPRVVYPDGSLQYLCKLVPTPADLLFRRFLPEKLARKRMVRFEMRNTAYRHIMEVPYLSGCFMLLRTSTLKEVGLFDERFFMYPEDIDLTRRIHRRYKTVFYPAVTVIHHHEQSSYKNWRMLLIHSVNLVRYFNKWGWWYDPERTQINKRIIQLNRL